jgi:hypothetical protein
MINPSKIKLVRILKEIKLNNFNKPKTTEELGNLLNTPHIKEKFLDQIWKENPTYAENEGWDITWYKWKNKYEFIYGSDILTIDDHHDNRLFVSLEYESIADYLVNDDTPASITNFMGIKIYYEIW